MVLASLSGGVQRAGLLWQGALLSDCWAQPNRSRAEQQPDSLKTCVSCLVQSEESKEHKNPIVSNPHSFAAPLKIDAVIETKEHPAFVLSTGGKYSEQNTIFLCVRVCVCHLVYRLCLLRCICRHINQQHMRCFVCGAHQHMNTHMKKYSCVSS